MSTETDLGTEIADNYRTILLRDSRNGNAQYDERKAAAAITPGMLCQLDSSDKIEFNPTAGDTDAVLLFATEQVLEGKTIDDDYAADDITPYVAVQSGDQVYGIANAAIAVNAKVESAGNGKLRTLTTGKPVGFVAYKAASALDDRIIVQII